MLHNNYVYVLIAGTMVTTSACGVSHDPHLYIAGFETQVRALEVISADLGLPVTVSDLVIELRDDMPANNEAGLCISGSLDDSPTILINRNFWNIATDTEREILLFHEMGHCVLDRMRHRDDYVNGEPSSIMNSCMCVWNNPATQSYYENHRNYYVNELITGAYSYEH